jgi:putative N6-adenine-specific DNA methylase
MSAYHAKTFAGLEELLAGELRALGATAVEPGRRGVAFEADMETLIRTCISSRYALTVHRPILAFDAEHPDELHRLASEWDWSSALAPGRTFAIDATVHSPRFFPHSQFAMLRLKDAIVDHFTRRGALRPSVERTRPDIRIHLHIADRAVTIALDAAGESLSRRGYRPPAAVAPLNEVLAAGLLGLAGWEPGTPLYDPMCGSGTFTVEAALAASGYPVNWHRRAFAFMQWRGYDPDAWWAVRDQLRQDIVPIPTPMFASDKDMRAVVQTRAALADMELAGDAEVGRADFFRTEPRTPDGLIVLNPPYGERLAVADAERMYTDIGDHIKFNWPGFTAFVLSPDLEGLKRIGMKPFVRHKVFNGPLECRWVGFTSIKEAAVEDEAPLSGEGEAPLRGESEG